MFAKIRNYLGAPGSTFVLLVEKFPESCSQMLPKCCHSSGCKLVLKTKGKLLKKDKKFTKLLRASKNGLKIILLRKNGALKAILILCHFISSFPF